MCPSWTLFEKGSSLKTRFRGLFVPLIAVLAVLAVLFAPSAMANSYTDNVAAQLKSSKSFVFSDANASAKFSSDQVRTLNSQINASKKYIFIVSVDDAQMRTVSPDAMPSEVFNSLRAKGVTDAAVAVFYRGGLRALGFGRAPTGTNQAGTDAFRAGNGNAMATATEFVKRVSALPSNTGPSTNNSKPSAGPSAPAKKSSSLTWLWVLLGVVAVIVVVVIVVVVRRKRVSRREDVQSSIRKTRNKLNTLSNKAVASEDVEEFNSATTNVDAAEKALKEGNLRAAEDYASLAKTDADAAERKLNPRPVTVSSGAGARVSNGSSRSSGGAAVDDGARRYRNPQGQTVIVNTNDYRTAPSPGYAYPYNGLYYSNPWWEWVMLDTMLDHQYGYGGYGSESAFERGFDAGERDRSYGQSDNVGGGNFNDNDGWTQSNDDSPQVGGGDFNDGGGWSNDAPTYSAPDPDPAPSWDPPADTGGGWGDSGGGWSDSGSSGGDGW